MTQPPEPGPHGSLPDLLAIPPEAFGGDPDGCLTAFFLYGDGTVATVTRPLPGSARLAEERAGLIARGALETVAREGHGADNVVFAGYGPQHLVDPVARALRQVSADSLVPVADIVRAEDSRYWSFLRDSPPGGELAGNWGLWRALAPAGGREGDEFERLTLAAHQWLGGIVQGAATLQEGLHDMSVASIDVVSAAIRRCRDGQDPGGDPATLARITVALANPWVFQDALARMDPDQAGNHLRLWTAATVAARPSRIAGPAALAAVTALQAGRREVARAAVARAMMDSRDDQPGKKLARMIADTGFEPVHGQVLDESPDDIADKFRLRLLELGDGPGSPEL